MTGRTCCKQCSAYVAVWLQVVDLQQLMEEKREQAVKLESTVVAMTDKQDRLQGKLADAKARWGAVPWLSSRPVADCEKQHQAALC